MLVLPRVRLLHPKSATSAVLAEPSITSSLTPKLQQMIQSALFSLGLTTKTHPTSFVWYLDSGASNYITTSFANLTNIHKYTCDLQIHTVDGQRLPIIAIVYIPDSLTIKHVFYSPHLCANLISIDQLVENNFKVSSLALVVLCRIGSRGK